MNWNLWVQFSKEKKKDQPAPAPSVPVLDKQVPQATSRQAVEEEVPNDIPNVPKEHMQQTHATTKQHTEDMEIPKDHKKGTKRKSWKKDNKISDSGKMKNSKEWYGNLFPKCKHCQWKVIQYFVHRCTVEYGLEHDISTVFGTEDACAFPQYKEPLLNFLLDESVGLWGAL